MQSNLPDEIKEDIFNEAQMYAWHCPGVSPRIAYSAGADEWSKWKVKYEELKAEFIELGKRYSAAQATMATQAIQHQLLKDRWEKMEAALRTWVELDKLNEGDGFQKGFELQTKALKLTDEAISYKHEGINEKEGEV